MKQIAIIAAVAVAAVGVLVYLSQSRPDADDAEARAGVHRSTTGTTDSSHGGAGAGGGLSAQNLADHVPKRGSHADGAAGGDDSENGSGVAGAADVVRAGATGTHAMGKAGAQGGADGSTLLLAANAPAGGTGPQKVPDRTSDQQQAMQNAGMGDAAPEVAYASEAGKTFPVNSQQDIPLKDKMSGDAGSVSFWLQPGWQGKGDDASFVQFGDSSLQLTKNIDFLRFEYIDPDGVERGLGMNIDAWQAGDWHQVTGTWQNNQYYLYVDGQLVSQNNFPLGPDFQGDTHLMVGSDLPNGATAAPGTIDEMTVLNRMQSAAEIAQLFKDGSTTHH